MTVEITVFKNRKTSKGVVKSCTWEDLKDRLRNPVITEESIGEYMDMTNEERTDIKDVGGFVGGRMKDGTRSKAALVNRTLLTIDADDAKPGDVEKFMAANVAAFCCHTTHTSTEENPRLRWVFPLKRPVTADEYRILAAKVSLAVGADTIDETTDQPERLMFWPSQAFDGDFQFWEGGVDPLDPDEILDEADEIQETEVPQKEKMPRDGEQLVIPEGGRNKTVFSFAATLRSKGLDREIIRRMVSDFNETYCVPPLPDRELDTICRSVCGYEAGSLVSPRDRTPEEDFADLGPVAARKEKKPEGLKMESADSLFSRYIPPQKFVVPGLIPSGLTILASPPKFGKSWMCLDMAISVATGTEFLGVQTNQDGVIYLALEDGDRRLQERGRKVLNGREMPKCLHFVKEPTLLADGLLKKIEVSLDSAGHHIGMVIIDTLQKIRGVAAKTEGVYGYDYRELGQLQQFALDRDIALVVVHHLNKGGDDSDFVARLNGSTGVSGAADSIITLTRASRGSDETKMSITGRDVQERVMIIQMDWSNYRWLLLGEEKDVEKDREDIEFHADPLVKTILWGLDEAEDMLLADDEHEYKDVVWSCTPQELMDEAKRLYGKQYDNAVAVGREVAKLAKKLEEKEGITYEYKRIGKDRRRTHVFTREIL